MRRHYPTKFHPEVVEKLDQLNCLFIGGEHDNGIFGRESKAPSDFRPFNEIVILDEGLLLPIYDYSFRPDDKGKPKLEEARILEVWNSLKEGEYATYPKEAGTNFDILIRLGRNAILLNKTDGTASDIVNECGTQYLRSIMNQYILDLTPILATTTSINL